MHGKTKAGILCVPLSVHLAIIHYAPQWVCVSIWEHVCVCWQGVWLWTRWHIQRLSWWLMVIFMWECPPAAQLGLGLTKKKGKKQQPGSQFRSVHADISDRKLEQGDREKNISIHNGWRGRGSVLDDTGIGDENDKRKEVYKERGWSLSIMTLVYIRFSVTETLRKIL